MLIFFNVIASNPIRRNVLKGALWASCRHGRPNGRGHWCYWRNPSSENSNSCLEENVKFNNFLIRYISNFLTFKIYFRNKISIYNVFNMLFKIIWYIVLFEFMWIVTFSKIIWNSIIFIQNISKNPLKMVFNVFIF